MKQRSISPLLFALAAPLMGAAPAPNYAEMMKALHVPGMVVVVAERGSVVSNDAYGVKNLKTQQPVDVHTRFEIGSITKQFTAAAILQLKERGLLSLDDRLSKYVPQYSAGSRITLRDMLLQISGIPNYTDTKAFGKLIVKQNGTYVLAKPGDVAGVLALIEHQRLDFAPGSKWEYSNSNYFLLGHVVELVAHQPWSAYIREHIFNPAGMSESGFMEDEAAFPDMATGYADDKGVPTPAGSFRGWAGGAGAIVSTGTDLAKWDDALASGKIVSADDLQLMMAPGFLPAIGNGHYGFGWVIDTYDGQPRVWHNGGTLGFNSSNQLYPATHQAIVVLTNSGAGADTLADRTFDALHPDLAAAQNTPASGEDPAITARAKAIWAQFAAGTPDRSQFDDKMNKALTPDLVAQAKQFATLGPATSWVYTGRKSQAGVTTYVYRVAFSSGTRLNVYMSVDADGKIGGYLATP